MHFGTCQTEHFGVRVLLPYRYLLPFSLLFALFRASQRHDHASLARLPSACCLLPFAPSYMHDGRWHSMSVKFTMNAKEHQKRSSSALYIGDSSVASHALNRITPPVSMMGPAGGESLSLLVFPLSQVCFCECGVWSRDEPRNMTFGA